MFFFYFWLSLNYVNSSALKQIYSFKFIWYEQSDMDLHVM